MARDSTTSSLVFYGALITSQSPYLIKYLPHALICVEKGIIQWMEEDISDAQLHAALSSRGLQESSVVRLQRGKFLIPGFIDTHTVCLILSSLCISLKKRCYRNICSMPLNSPISEGQ